jgi:4-hydroxy-3-polyprenylbenzoate decarboxylase
MKPTKKVAIAIGGASGAIYAQVLLDKLTQLRAQTAAIGVVMSKNAQFNWKFELGNEDYLKYDFNFYDSNDFMAPFASGSAKYDTMIICPCSMGLLARIASGVSNDLATRAADVMLKERRRLILVPRETPLSIIHINNMKTVTEAGAIICPAIPSFYSRPQTVEAMIATVIDRVLDLAGFDLETYRWGDA